MTIYATSTTGTNHHEPPSEATLQPGGWLLLRDRYPRPDQRQRLAERYLHPSELDQRPAAEDRAHRWLLDRVVAKDTVAMRLADHGHAVTPQDFAVQVDHDGGPRVTGVDHAVADLRVSVARVEGCSVAIAAQGTPVGIAVAAVEEQPSAFNRLAFSRSERANRHLAGVDDRTWMAAAWCAKYAAARASGGGLDGDAAGLETRVAGPGLLAVADRVVRWVQLDTATATSRDGRSLIVGWTVVPEHIIDLDRSPGRSPGLTWLR